MQESESTELILQTQVMHRPRIDKIFEQATRCRLVYVIAGAGYGKSQAVYQYIEQQPDAVVRWIQLTESDNVGSHFWETLVHTVSLDNPELATRLAELGFPQTPPHSKQLTAILKSAEHGGRLRNFLVLDDFHLIHSKQLADLAERYANIQIPSYCMIIISRKEPEIDPLPLLAKGRISIVTEEELRFTDRELAAFMKWHGIAVPARKLPLISEATNGRALAIQLLTMILKREPKNFELALDAMKQSILKLMGAEAFNDLPDEVKQKALRLSLVSSLPSELWREVLDGDISFIERTPQLASFMWFDSFIGNYRIHPLYLEFLQSRQDMLSEDEKRAVYSKAAKWCFDHKFYMDAMYYCAKLRLFNRMVKILLCYPFRLPHDTCEYFLNILDELWTEPGWEDDKDALFLKHLFTPMLLTGVDRYEEARELSLEVIRHYESLDEPPAKLMMSIAYSNLSYIELCTCVYTHRYDAPEYLQKCVEYFKKSAVPPLAVAGSFIVPNVLSFACPVGEGAKLEEFDECVEAARKCCLYIAENSHNIYYGYDDLVACEIAFYKNQPEAAKIHAHQAVMKAREKKQYSIEAMAAQFLLRIAVHEGDYPLTKEILKQLRDYLDNPDFWNRQLLYDLFVGSFYSRAGLTDMIPDWLFLDERDVTSEVHIPVSELIVCAQAHIASKKYDRALTVLSSSFPRGPLYRFLFGELRLSLLTAVARIKTGDAAGALADFEKAYSLSFNGVFEMPFVELGKDLRPLISALDGGSSIPEDWLVMISRKASAHAKKIDFIAGIIKREQNINEDFSLSDRERDVLNDLYHGLSREEIAASRYLSVNTVKTVLGSLYMKLGASNNVDAIRIAIEKKLVE